MGFKTIDELRAFVDAMVDIITDDDGKDDDHIIDEDEMVSDDELTDGIDYDDDDDGDDDCDGDELTESTAIVNEHVVTVGYSDENDVVVLTYDNPKSRYSMCAALLTAAANLWPGTKDIDDKLCDCLWDLADGARGLTDE